MYNGEDIYYDDIGNPVEYYGNRNFTWLGRQMLTANVNNIIYEFTYNDEGLRTSKSVFGVPTFYYYSGDLLVAETGPEHSIIYIYDESGSPIGMQYREHVYAEGEWDVFLYKKNILGDIDGVITPGKGLTYSEAKAWVAAENDLLCRDHSSAIAIVKFYPSSFREDGHRGGPKCGYLNHYHLSSAHSNHIWYYGD